MSKLQGRYIYKETGLPLAVFETGVPTGVPVMFLHGFGYSHAAFRPQFESGLAGDFRLLAMDARGHGYSGKPWTESDYAGTEIWADDLERVLDACDVENAILVGWSYGAMICMDWVRKYGSRRASGFVFTGSHGGLVPYTAAELKAKAKTNEDLRRQTPDFEHDITSADAFIDRMVHAPLSGDMKEALLLSRQMLPHYALQVMGSRAFENSDLKERIGRPLLFIQGEHDFANPPDVIRAVAATVPQSKVEIVEGAGHLPSAEHPEAFNAILRSFINEISSR